MRGFCFDGAYWYDDGGMTIYIVWEVKTARYGTSRRTNRRVCTFIRRKVLANVIASILKEYPAATACHYRYIMVFADRQLVDALDVLRDKGEINLLNINNVRPGPIATLGDLIKEAKAPDVAYGKQVVQMFLSTREYSSNQGCDYSIPN